MRILRRSLLLVPLAAALAVFGFGVGSGGFDRAAADTYTIQEGDTLWEIASRLQIGVSVLLALNTEITSPDAIYVGQSIQVPDNTTIGGGESGNSDELELELADAGATQVYVIDPGDTLSEIADDFGTDVDALLALNPALSPQLIRIGDEILVPSAGSSGAAADSPTNTVVQMMQTREYVIQPGDSLSAIAAEAGVSLDMLRAHNQHLNFDVIHPGQIMNIPTPAYHVPALDPNETSIGLTEQYTVRAGDNASYVAEMFGISLAELRMLNPTADLSTIYIGQTLIVPWTGRTSNAAPGTVQAVEVRRRTYQVQAGDTFSDIAVIHGLTLEELRALNPLRPNDLILIGEVLYLPGTIGAPVVAEERTLWEGDLLQYAAAKLGVTPHTLMANTGLNSDAWLSSGTSWRLPLREGLLVTVQPGDTLLGIANTHGVGIDLILADPANGVDDPNAIVIGQELILPIAMPDFAWPVEGVLTDPFGQCRNWDCSYRHHGLDVALDFLEPIAAAADGLVTFVGGDPQLGLGWYVEIEHEHGWRTVYAHLSQFRVAAGQYVNQGDVIGDNGSTGHSTGPHLHFEVQHNDLYVDPLVVLPDLPVLP